MPRTITKTLNSNERAWLREFCDRHSTQTDVAAEIGCSRSHFNASIRENASKTLSRTLWKRLLRAVVEFESAEFDGERRLTDFRLDVASRETIRDLEDMRRHVERERERDLSLIRSAAARERGVVRVGVPT
jgi:hypothetical protein